MEENKKDIMQTKGLGWRVSLSIITGVAWLVFLILWLFFYASNYSGYQNFAIIILSILAVAVVLSGPWIIWGMKHQTKEEKEMWKTQGFRWRVWLSGILAIVLVFFLIYWFWYQAATYDLYQNIAIFIVSILIIGGVMGASWAPWGIKHGQKFEHKKSAAYYHKEKKSEETEEEKE